MIASAIFSVSSEIRMTTLRWLKPAITLSVSVALMNIEISVYMAGITPNMNADIVMIRQLKPKITPPMFSE